MSITSEILAVFDETLSLGDRTDSWTDETELLGAIPELDSLAVTSVMFALEEQFGVIFSDDELGAEVFATVGSLRELIESKIKQEA